MYTRSVVQKDIFKSSASVMEPHTRGLYEDRNAWHNRFREQVTNKIDEDVFKPLKWTILCRIM